MVSKRQSRKKLPPSTRARWQWKLRLARFLCRLFPVSVFVVEDIKAGTRGKRRWDQSFSPLEVGKQWFYVELSKLAEVWEAHCLDAWVLAESVVGGKTSPDNRRLVCIAPFAWHHRQLHRFQPEKGGKRKPYGGTLSQRVKRGTLVEHPRWGKATVGGTMHGKLSLHNPQTNSRLTQTAHVTDCRPIKLLRWRARLVPLAPIPSSPALKKGELLPPWHDMRRVSASRVRK
jgi:hypothetical protein